MHHWGQEGVRVGAFGRTIQLFLVDWTPDAPLGPLTYETAIVMVVDND